jgi:hypothetical protein
VEELAELDRKLKIKDDDEVVFVGDLMDKGPYSSVAVAYIRHLRDEGVPVTLVEGNHEDKYRRFRRHQEVFEETGRKNPMLGASWLQEVMDKLKVEDIEFLEGAVLWHQVPSRNLLIVHGGVPSWMRRLPHPKKWRNGKKARRDRAAAMLRLRYEDKAGNMVGLGDEKPRDKFWAEKYDGRFGTVLFGHEARWKPATPNVFKHAIGIDTGCCYGGALTAAVYEAGVEEPWFCSVDAREEYCSPTELRGSKLPGPNYVRRDVRVIDRSSLSTGTPYRSQSVRHKKWFGDY